MVRGGWLTIAVSMRPITSSCAPTCSLRRCSSPGAPSRARMRSGSLRSDPAVSEVTQQFKVAARAGVDDQPAVGRIGHQAPDVRKRAALRLLEVVQERAGGPHGGGEVLASKAIKGGHPQVREEKLAGRGRLESPIWERGKPGPGIGQLVEARRVSFRGQDLSGSQPGQLFCETAVAVLPRNFGDLKLTSGKIGRRHTPDAAWRVRSNQVVIGVVRE